MSLYPDRDINGFQNPVLAKIPKWAFYVIIFMASVMVTTLFMLVLPKEWSTNESSDYTSFYEPVARNILAGKGYTKTGTTIETFYPPGYPIILAAQFAISKATSIPEPLVLQIFLVVFTALSVLFLFDLARRFSNTKSALIVAFLWMTYPFLLWLTKQPNSELAFMAILFGACDLFFSTIFIFVKKDALLIPAGLLFGCAMLVRPIAVFFPLFLIIVIWISFRITSTTNSLKKTALLLIGVIVAVLPWEIYAFSNTGRVIFLSNNDSASMRGGLVYAVSDDLYKEQVRVPDDVRSLMLDTKRKYDDLNSTSKILGYLASQFVENPVAVFKLFGLKALRSWYATDSQRLESYILLIQIPYLIIILVGSRFSWKAGGVARKLLVGIWALVFINWLMNIAVTSTLRYMVPVIGLLFVTVAFIPLFTNRSPSHNRNRKSLISLSL